MDNVSLLFYLNAYSDPISTNAPNQNNFKWTREIKGLSSISASSVGFILGPGETKSLFDSVRTLAQDNTTQYSLALAPLSTNTYALSWAAGTAPNFRVPRALAIDATTQITVTQNGPVMTFASIAGAALDTSACQIGDQVTIGNLFSILNQGQFSLISKTSNSLSVANINGTPEGPITLGTGFATQIAACSSTGVQVGDTLNITAGFSVVSQGSYKVTQVNANSLQFQSIAILPQESNILTQVSIYEFSKRFIYMESDQHVSMIVNGVAGNEVWPFVIGSATKPGVWARTSTMYSFSVKNESLTTANVWVATVN